MAIKILDSVKSARAEISARVKTKLEKEQPLTDEELAMYEVTDEDEQVFGLFSDYIDGKPVPGFKFQDFLASPQARVLIPRVLVGKMRKAMEPNYLASAFYKKIRLKNGQAVLFPSIGVMRAYNVSEGQEIPQETIDWQVHKNSMIEVRKSGLRLQFSEEMISDCDFDLISIMMEEAGRAMSRHKEQKAFYEWMTHSWTVFDNAIRAKNPDAGTTGVDFYGNYNDTMSVDDFLDLVICVYNNEYTPTDLIMHPLAWTSFVRNGLTGAFTAPFERETTREKPTASFAIGPESIQGRLPLGFHASLSPFAPFDKVGKTFDMFCVDRNNIGVMIVKDDIKTEEFDDPSRDIRNIKMVERYGFGTFNEGRAICKAKNISMAKSFATPERVHVLNSQDHTFNP